MRLRLTALARSKAARIVVSLAAMCIVGFLFWWKGPSLTAIGDAFTQVRWEWVAIAIALNLASVVVRALAWRTVIRQAM